MWMDIVSRNVFPDCFTNMSSQTKTYFAVIERIIQSVLLLYPQQALWQLMAVSRSTYRAKELVDAILAFSQSACK